MNNNVLVSKNLHYETSIALAIFTGLGLVFFYPVLLGYLISQSDYLFFVSPWNTVRPDDLLAASNPYLQDQTTEFLAFFLAAKSQILNGMWPLWNPFILTGTPLMANTQSALLFPLNWGHFILPAGWGFTISALLKVILAPWFTYLLARRLQLSHTAGLIGGVAYGFCTFHVFWLNHPHSNVTLLIPLCFYATENLLLRQNLKAVIVLALITAFTLFGGHVEIALFTAIACAVYFLVRVLFERQLNWRLLFQFTAAYVGSLMITAVMMIPFLEFLSVAAVWEERSNFVHYTMPISAMPTVLFSDFFRLPGWAEHYLGFHISSLYIGISTLPLLIMSFIKGKWRYTTPWLVVLLVSLMLAFDIGPLYNMVKYLPVMGHLPMFYWAALVTFAGAMLVAIGWHSCVYAQVRIKSLVVVVLGLGLILWLVVFLWHGYDYADALIDIGVLKAALKQRAWVYGAVFIVVSVIIYLAPKYQRRMSYLMLVVVFTDLWWFNHGWNPTVSTDYVYPQQTPSSVTYLQQQSGPYRILGLDHILKPSTNMLVKLEEVRGYDVPVNLRYHNFFKQALTGSVSYWVYEKTSLQERIMPYLSGQNVRYILSKNTLQESFDMPLIYEDEIKIYKNLEAEERLFYRSKAHYVDSPEAALTQLLAEPDQLKEQVIIEADSNMMLPSELESTANFNFKLVAHNAQKLTAEVTMPGAGWLIHAAAFYPGWKAYVDGDQVPIYAANYTQQGIYLKSGKHRVRFRYDPLSFKIGLLLTLLSFTGVLWILIKNKK